MNNIELTARCEVSLGEAKWVTAMNVWYYEAHSTKMIESLKSCLEGVYVGHLVTNTTRGVYF